MSSKKLVNILLHALFSIFMIVVVIFLMPLKENPQPDFIDWPRIIFTCLQIIAFYCNAYLLYPRLLLRKKVVTYIVTVIVISAFIALVPGISYAASSRSISNILAHGIIKFMIGLFVMGTGTAYRFIVDVIRNQHLQQENLATELSFLRSQVSPHFMFNTLNSMVSLARKKSDKLEPALLKMSGLMHYMLYDADEEKVNLTREIEYIHSYIELQTLRFGSMVKILLMVQQPDREYYIEPMLLIPLIENAFKHGIEVTEDPEINIQFNASEKNLSLLVSNKINTVATANADKTRGIGLANLKRRLNIMYPGRHELNAQKNGEWFHASLKIRLQS